MSRDIKYQLWDTDKKIMISCYTLAFSQGGISATDGCTTQGWVKANKGFEHLTPTLIAREYTGIKDKYKKDIYEGDIVKRTSGMLGDKYDGFTGIVKFECAAFMIESFDGTYGVYLWDDVQELEIVGNIYEDPDLLAVISHD